MGSIGMFDSVLCVACKEWTLPRTYSGVEYCDRCGVKSRRKLIIDKIDFGVELGEEFRNRFAAFLGSGVYWKQQQPPRRTLCVAFAALGIQEVYLLLKWSGREHLGNGDHP